MPRSEQDGEQEAGSAAVISATGCPESVLGEGVPYVQLTCPGRAPPASMVGAVRGGACARGLVGNWMSP